ncbi:hypothetical protein L227DRAFT_362390 [Lentinus tigrinus ALCF2SS1-6]|uniref:Uncharacterized protein n=1 Tax=Lentinus tigrinus ALCF2SS1-6 TaxID=1328759 RepID=A0A5C2SKW4_9APHY|nr:hypothetical protein L227DRAFT_362390 [Lentinus tigrinus ALCF2SS1-6]
MPVCSDGIDVVRPPHVVRQDIAHMRLGLQKCGAPQCEKRLRSGGNLRRQMKRRYAAASRSRDPMALPHETRHMHEHVLHALPRRSRPFCSKQLAARARETEPSREAQHHSHLGDSSQESESTQHNRSSYRFRAADSVSLTDASQGNQYGTRVETGPLRAKPS